MKHTHFINHMHMCLQEVYNVIVNGVSLNAFLLRLAIGQGCELSPLLFNITGKVLVSAKGVGERHTD